jgi:hypothetical protein
MKSATSLHGSQWQIPFMGTQKFPAIPVDVRYDERPNLRAVYAQKIWRPKVLQYSGSHIAARWTTRTPHNIAMEKID